MCSCTCCSIEEEWPCGRSLELFCLAGDTRCDVGVRGQSMHGRRYML